MKVVIFKYGKPWSRPIAPSHLKPKNCTRRRFLAAASAALAAPALARAGRTDAPAKAERPNLIFLLSDDQRWDALGCAGNAVVRTPNLDAMAGQGVRFRNAFVTTAICCTSRASIFLGQYARRHAIWDFQTDFSNGQLDRTYPMLLKQAGYQTGFIGKYGVGNNLPTGRYDYWKGLPGQPVYETKDERGERVHLTRLNADQAVEFLETCKNNQPFCLSISFKAPHAQDEDPRQFVYDPVDEGLYRDVAVPVPRTAGDDYFMKFPDWFRTDNEGRVRWAKRFSSPALYQDMAKGYYRLVTGMDRAIGEIRNALEKRGLADNTVLVFTSDNGFYMGEHGLTDKWYGHDESIRVPLVIFDPLLPRLLRGRTRNEMVLNIDLAPTLLDMAGIQIPATMQGQSLVPLLAGKRPAWPNEFFYEHLFVHPRIPCTEGVVTGAFKYLHVFKDGNAFEELYDRRRDPFEENNLAPHPKHRRTLERFRERLGVLRRAAA